ncbi:hypothetical protein PANDA_021510 [Ailuropoda melanoleuca]|uniref:Uncharacterized protein n=1 Tax=Ailuropoda melanoleuca TaxID=9646 RepID=D2I6P4_AILME|nr:hypothetical protein PANDA_021510 [Ailuropoda melanoleuca]
MDEQVTLEETYGGTDVLLVIPKAMAAAPEESQQVRNDLMQVKPQMEGQKNLTICDPPGFPHILSVSLHSDPRPYPEETTPMVPNPRIQNRFLGSKIQPGAEESECLFGCKGKALVSELLTSWGFISEAYALICLQVSSKINALNPVLLAES